MVQEQTAELRIHMMKAAPKWTQMYESAAAASDDEAQAALILAAADAPHRDGWEGQAEVAKSVSTWIQAICDDHPLCAKQSAVLHFSFVSFVLRLSWYRDSNRRFLQRN